jgi:tetratricopeptide (TPR) repeat protein
MRSRGLSLVVLSFVVVGLGTSAFAQGGDKTGAQKRADELFEEGRKLMNAGDQNAAEACAKFDEAIKLDPNAPGTMLNLGLCNEKLNKYKTALYWFRKAQARAAETNLPDYEAAAKQHTIDLASKVATIKIQFATPAPEGTKVKIDAQELSPAEYLAAEVDPGEHTLIVGAPGHKIFTQDFTVEGRGGQTLTVSLVQGDNSVVVDRGAGRRRAAIYTAVGGGVLLAGSLTVSIIAAAKYNNCANNGDLHQEYADCPYPDIDDAQKATDYANKYQKLAQIWGTTLFVAGAVTVGVASYLYFTAPEKERVDRTVFVPAIGPDQVGFAVSGGF